MMLGVAAEAEPGPETECRGARGWLLVAELRTLLLSLSMEEDEGGMFEVIFMRSSQYVFKFKCLNLRHSSYIFFDIFLFLSSMLYISFGCLHLYALPRFVFFSIHLL